MRRLLLVLIVITFTVAIVGPILRGHGQSPPPAPGQQKAPAKRPSSDLEKLMQKKLQNAQKILEGLALNDLDVIKHHAQELMTLSKTAEFRVVKTPQYDFHSNEFRRTLEDMVKATQKGNIDSATLGYMEMTLSCVRCHKHIREIRVTQIEPDQRLGKGVKFAAD
jgi:hypothetical protein